MRRSGGHKVEPQLGRTWGAWHFSRKSYLKKSLMAEWLEQAFQWHEMYCHDLEVMSSNPGQVELGVLGTPVLSCTWTKKSHYSKQEFIVLKSLKHIT